MADESDRRARGLAVYKQMGWGENTAVKELDEDLWRFTTDVLFGEIWSRPGLSLRERELVTLATLMAAKADGIALHMRHAHNLGITFDEMKEVILQSTIYLGMPKALFAMRKLKAVMAEAGEGGTGAKSVTGGDARGWHRPWPSLPVRVLARRPATGICELCRKYAAFCGSNPMAACLGGC